MDKSKLKSLMALHNDTGKTLSHFLGISEQAFSMKLNEKDDRGFTKKEVEEISKRYSMSPDQVISVFLQIWCLEKTQHPRKEHI